MKEFINKKKKIVYAAVIALIGLLAIVFVAGFFKSPSEQVKTILESKGVNQLKYSILYDASTKTIKVDGDLEDRYGRDDYDYDNFLKSIPELFKSDLVHQFEYSKQNSVDTQGAYKMNLKVISGTSFRFNKDIFYSWKWNKNDTGICQRQISVIPQFAHISEAAAQNVSKILTINKCNLWNDVKSYKSLYKYEN